MAEPADGGSMRAQEAFDVGERRQLVAFLEAHLEPGGDGRHPWVSSLDAVVTEYEDGFHGFHGMADFEPVAGRAWADLGRWAREAAPEERP